MNKFLENLVNHLYKHYILWSFLAVLLVSLFDVSYYFMTEGKLFYLDTDCYTRALRIVDWLNEFQWAEKIFPYSNIPDGFVLHFTRINDVIWVILSLPFMLFEPLKEAVFHGGMLFSPLFLFLSLSALFWGIQPYIIKFEKTAVSFALVFITTLMFCYRCVYIFDFSFPDHHSVMFCVFCFNIAVIIRYLANPKENHFLAAGFVCGLGLWFSSAVEGMLVAAIILAVLCFDWLYGIFKSRYIMLWGLGLFIGTTISWLINPPYGGYNVTDIGRLSVIHVVLTALILLSFVVINYLQFSTKKAKISELCICSLLSVGILFVIFGVNTIFMPIYDKDIKIIYLPYVADMISVFKTSYLHYYCYILSWIVGLIIVAYLLCSNKFKKIYSLNLALLVLLTIPLGFEALRFYPYYLAVFLYLNSIIIFLWMHLSVKSIKYSYVMLMYLVMDVLFLVSFRADLSAPKIPDLNNDVNNLATDRGFAPLFAWKNDIKTLSFPYHTDIKGIVDCHKLFFSTDENEIKQILQNHQINYVYLPEKQLNDETKPFKETYYIEPERNIDKFYGKIMTGKNLYDWLEVIQIDDDNVIYKVRYDLF